MPSIAHSRQLRCCALVAVSLAALALGCTDQVAGPAATAPARAPAASAFDPGDPADAPDALSLTIGVDSKTGGGGSGDASFFPVWTVVDVTASGIVELTWEPASGYSGHAGQLDPGGRRLGYYNDICSGYGAVYAVLANANGSYVAWNACYSLKDNFHTRMLVKDYLVIGRSVDATVQLYNPPWHACGYAWLGWPGDCVSYSGSQSVSVTRLNADLTLAADSTSVGEGSAVTFTAGASPERFDAKWGVPVQMIRWRWTPDEMPEQGAPRTQPCGAVTVCRTQVFESGTMSAEAFVNGKKLSKDVHVDVAPYEVRITMNDKMLRWSRHELHKSEPKCNISAEPYYRRLQVGVYKGGKVVPNREVRLVVTAADEAGGHVAHTGERPVGGFLEQTQENQAAGQRELTINTGTSGLARLSYEAPEFGGQHTITATSENAKPAKKSLTVGKSLEALGAGHWTEYGNGRDTHPHVWYGLAAMNQQLLQLADSFYTTFATNIEYNDYSLEFGGRFDVKATWDGLDHCSHRFGNAIDVHTNGEQPLPARRVRYIQAMWSHIAGNDSAVVIEGDHYHLKQWP